ncbi:hypothetical protein [Marinobacterium marinum]|uniref:Uncharacterized protein n=1 Tax=Marinobacterium marinum TaxID=2756129 RepID=A0A7W1WYD8_9GAMM|nr:hypothetical protein [Marinobacterium marinum]MBA4502327.1 hypothetical protein [Marinobacterium marinum]
MKWIDREKGILDYFFAAIPLLTLFFLISAYFHTVHPRFKKEEELSKLNIEIVNLKEKLERSETENLKLSDIERSLRGLLSDNDIRMKFLEEKYLSIAPLSEKEDYLRNRSLLYFSKQDVIDAFKENSQKVVSESGEKVDPATIRVIDVNVTGGSTPDLYLVDAWSCGSGGCMGPLFIQYNGVYCFSAWAHSKTIKSIIKSYNLKCSNFSDENIINLSDIIESKS